MHPPRGILQPHAQRYAMGQSAFNDDTQVRARGVARQVKHGNAGHLRLQATYEPCIHQGALYNPTRSATQWANLRSTTIPRFGRVGWQAKRIIASVLGRSMSHGFMVITYATAMCQ